MAGPERGVAEPFHGEQPTGMVDDLVALGRSTHSPCGGAGTTWSTTGRRGRPSGVPAAGRAQGIHNASICNIARCLRDILCDHSFAEDPGGSHVPTISVQTWAARGPRSAARISVREGDLRARLGRVR